MISIIMGIYNNKSTLCEALESIVNQTYTDWELIMCDDGSADNTYEIAEEFIKNHPNNKFKLIRHKKNMGLNQTLNDCLKEAEGEYIARMDGDDISLPTRFEKEVEFLKNSPQYAIVSTPMIFFDENGDFMQGVGGVEPEINSFAKGTPFCHAPCMVRCEAFEAVGGYSVSKKRLRVEDWDLWVRMYAAGFKGYNLSEPLYKMRDDRSAYSRRKFKYRINESRVSASAVKTLKLPFKYYIFSLRPIIVGMLPKVVYNYLHKRRYQRFE